MQNDTTWGVGVGVMPSQNVEIYMLCDGHVWAKMMLLGG